MGDRASNSPEVLVLGMPSSGKTVFLSVLGRNFTLVADDSDARPLGFRMRAIGRSTQETVSRNYARLLGGEWPASTVAGSVTPLTWDVFTGARKVFTLSSMDVSGESFVKAFCEEGSETIRQKEKDGLLDMAQSESGTGDVVELLRELALSAKVICFFVNIAIARRGRLQAGGGLNARQVDIDALRNYEEGIANICALLDELPSLRSKAIVVLTQAHRHQSEIEKSGGPAAFLGRIAPNLRQTVAEFDIPVIAVSAINERDSEDGFDEDDEENLVPETIESDGLFGFLLVVAGMIPDARLAVVKDCYLRYLADKARYLQLMCRTILERLPLVKAYASSGAAFEKACLDYLGDAANVNSDGKESLSRSVIDLYRRCTVSDKDVSAAASAWKRRLAIDMAWNHVFRRIVLEEAKMMADDAGSGKTSKMPTSQEIVEAVRNELASVPFCGGGLAHAALYGFEKNDLDPTRDAVDEDAWVMKCLEECRLRMASDLDDCMQQLIMTRQMIAAIDPMRGEDFNIKKEAVVEAISRYKELLSAFEGEWFVNEVGGLPQLGALKREVATLSESLGRLEQKHSKWIDKVEADRQQKAFALAKARQLAYEKEAARVQRLRRIRMLVASIGMAVIAVMLVCAFAGGRNKLVWENTRHTDEAIRAYNGGNYESAKEQLDLVCNHPFFFVERRSFVDAAFEKKVLDSFNEKRRKEEEERQRKIDAQRKEICAARASAVKMGVAREYLQDVDDDLELVDKSYSDNEIVFDRYIEKLGKCGDAYKAIAERVKTERAIVKVANRCDAAKKDAVTSGAIKFSGADMESADEKRRNATTLYSNGKIGSERYLAMLGEVEQLYKDARRKAEDAQVSKAEGECDYARKEAEECGANEFASADLSAANTKKSGAEESYSDRVIDFRRYIEILGDAAELYKVAKSKAEKFKIANVKDECETARLEAEKIDAEFLAFPLFNEAERKRNDAESEFSNFSSRVEALKTAIKLYSKAKAVAERNQRKVLVRAKLKDESVNVPIYKDGVPCETGMKGGQGVVVNLNRDELGEVVRFEAEGIINGIVYVGESNYTVKKGEGDNVVIYLTPKYTLDLHNCPYCEFILGSDYKHRLNCPRCNKDLSQWLK